MTTFNAGVGSSTLPLYIYGKIKFGVTPEINAISTIIVAVTAVAILIAWRARRVPTRGRPSRRGRGRVAGAATGAASGASLAFVRGGRRACGTFGRSARGSRTAGDVALEDLASPSFGGGTS